MVRASLILLVLQNAVYIALLTLGCYFIYQGKVIQRYLIQRTDFSEYSEAMSELPTLTTFILPFETLTFGKDFNVSFYPKGSSIKRNLFIGTNNISNTLQADFEQIYGVSLLNQWLFQCLLHFLLFACPQLTSGNQNLFKHFLNSLHSTYQNLLEPS